MAGAQRLARTRDCLTAEALCLLLVTCAQMTHTSLPGEPVQQISDDAITLPYFFVSAGLETLFLNEFLLGKNLPLSCLLMHQD